MGFYKPFYLIYNKGMCNVTLLLFLNHKLNAENLLPGSMLKTDMLKLDEGLKTKPAQRHE